MVGWFQMIIQYKNSQDFLNQKFPPRFPQSDRLDDFPHPKRNHIKRRERCQAQDLGSGGGRIFLTYSWAAQGAPREASGEKPTNPARFDVRTLQEALKKIVKAGALLQQKDGKTHRHVWTFVNSFCFLVAPCFGVVAGISILSFKKTSM